MAASPAEAGSGAFFARRPMRTPARSPPLRGAPAATVFQSLDDFSLGADRARLIASLARLYGMQTDALGKAGANTLDAVHRIEKLRATVYQPASGANYGSDDFSKGLLQIAR